MTGPLSGSSEHYPEQGDYSEKQAPQSEQNNPAK